jgi:hypothetical protein
LLVSCGLHPINRNGSAKVRIQICFFMVVGGCSIRQLKLPEGTLGITNLPVNWKTRFISQPCDLRRHDGDRGGGGWIGCNRRSAPGGPAMDRKFGIYAFVCPAKVPPCIHPATAKLAS